jgi:hypothetical protein
VFRSLGEEVLLALRDIGKELSLVFPEPARPADAVVA